MQVWFALEEKNIEYDTVLINLQNKPDWFKELVPTQLVPAVKINGKLVYESFDILMVRFSCTASACKLTHLDGYVAITAFPKGHYPCINKQTHLYTTFCLGSWDTSLLRHTCSDYASPSK